MSFANLTADDLAPWMNAPLPARPAPHASSVVIPCDSPEHADRLARLLRYLAADSHAGARLTEANAVLFSACAKAEVK